MDHDPSAVWLVIIKRESEEINGGYRLSEAFTHRGAADEYASEMREKNGIESADVVMRGVNTHNYR